MLARVVYSMSVLCCVLEENTTLIKYCACIFTVLLFFKESSLVFDREQNRPSVLANLVLKS